MYRMSLRLLGSILIAVALMLLPSLLSSHTAAVQAQGGGQETIDELLKAYAVALDNELRHGATEVIVDPADGATTILSGESQARMDSLWAETLEKIEAIQARPAAQRASAEELIRSVSGLEPSYMSRAGTPYDPSAVLEEYRAGEYLYHVDTSSDGIVLVWLEDQRDYSVLGSSSDEELMRIARDYVAKFSPSAALDGLSLTIANKEGTIFFRWEDKASHLADGTVAFLQVGLSRAGDLLNFENRLPRGHLGSATQGLQESWARLLQVTRAFAIGANEIYANGGSQWAWEIQSAAYSTQNNAGYCYIAGWCSPKNFYYASSPSGNNTYGGTYHRGRWSATTYMRYRNTRISAFIPGTHATAYVAYRRWYNGGASYVESYLDQNIWVDTFVNVGSGTLYDITKVVLPNVNIRSGTAQIAWDEIWDYVP